MDTLLAVTAFCHEDDMMLCFLDDGVFNLLNNQQPELILQKDFISRLKLLDLYEVKNRYVCNQSLKRLEEQEFIISCEKIDRTFLLEKLQLTAKVLTF